MEEIVLFTWLAVIIVVAVVQKQNKGKKNAENHIPSPKEILGDMFPEIDDYETSAEHEYASTAKPTVSFKRAERKKQAQHISTEKNYTPTESVPQKQKSKISISSRQEARRAFIYSEIFRRKY